MEPVDLFPLHLIIQVLLVDCSVHGLTPSHLFLNNPNPSAWVKWIHLKTSRSRFFVVFGNVRHLWFTRHSRQQSRMAQNDNRQSVISIVYVLRLQAAVQTSYQFSNEPTKTFYFLRRLPINYDSVPSSLRCSTPTNKPRMSQEWGRFLRNMSLINNLLHHPRGSCYHTLALLETHLSRKIS